MNCERFLFLLTQPADALISVADVIALYRHATQECEACGRWYGRHVLPRTRASHAWTVVAASEPMGCVDYRKRILFDSQEDDEADGRHPMLSVTFYREFRHTKDCEPCRDWKLAEGMKHINRRREQERKAGMH